jgi:hypothetical protein
LKFVVVVEVSTRVSVRAQEIRSIYPFFKL